MPASEGQSLMKPIIRKLGKILNFISCVIICEPFCDLNDSFFKNKNACLFACGFFFVFFAIYVAFALFFLAVSGSTLAVLCGICLLIAVIFTICGIWPTFICTLGVTAITIVRIPQNVYSHILVTYRTVVLRRNLKLVSFMLIPIIHILVPPVTFIVCLVLFLPTSAAVSFAGYPLEPWKRIPEIHKVAWKKFATEVDSFADNYGHWSGIPGRDEQSILIL